MNNKLLSYENLKELLKHIEIQQRLNKKIYSRKNCDTKLQSRYQKLANESRIAINVILSAIHHAKQARKLYEYKRLHENETTK